VHEELKPAGTFADLKHLAGVAIRTSRWTTSSAAAIPKKRLPNATISSNTHSARSKCCMCRGIARLTREPGHESLIIHTSRRLRLLCAWNRAAAWLAGKSRQRARPFLGGGYGAKVYVKMRRWRRRWHCSSAAVKIALTMEEQFYTISNTPRRSASKAA